MADVDVNNVIRRITNRLVETEVERAIAQESVVALEEENKALREENDALREQVAASSLPEAADPDPS